MNMRIVAVLTSLLFLTSCNTVPTAGQVIYADYGNAITAAECQSLAQAAISSKLGDPNARITFDAPCRRNWVRAIPESGIPIEYGYYQTGTYGVGNAEPNDYYVLIRDGRAIRAGISEQVDQVIVWRP